MKVARKIAAIYSKGIDYLAYLAGILVIFIMLATGTEVVVRKLFGFSMVWTVEYSEHAILYITFLSAAWLVKKRQHVKIDVVLNSLNPARQVWLNMVMYLVGAALCLFTAYHSALTVWDVWQRHVYTTTTLEIPMAPLIAIIGVGSLLLSIEFAKASYEYLKSRKVEIREIESRSGNL